MNEEHQFLAFYSGYLRRASHIDAASAALRTRSRKFRDVIAYVATYDKYTFDELREHVLSGELSYPVRYVWLAALGRVVALQAFQDPKAQTFDDDVDLGLACLEVANREIPQDNEHKQFHRLEVELLIEKRQLNEARALIEANEHLQAYYYGYLLTDLKNPSIAGTSAEYSEWLKGFNRPFIENGLSPVQIEAQSYQFNALGGKLEDSIESDKKVTVIMTCYRPQFETFSVAVRSILNQSWRNLELIVVDDASPPEYEPTLSQIENLDARITVIRLSENGGTYGARNAGIAVATGDFITGQDSDDWSHPQRIALQIDRFAAQPSTVGVLVEAVRVDENLVMASPGRLPQRPCEVSLMMRRDLALKLGGYIDARKGADSEYRLRLEHYTGSQVTVLEKPLYLTRVGHESLSNADFRPGWSHPARRAFWNASRFWHETTPSEQLRLDIAGFQPMPIPNRFKITAPVKPPEFDAIFAGDWRAHSALQRSMLDGARALIKAGKRVGVMQLESPLTTSKETTRLSQDIQQLIGCGEMAEVIPDEDTQTGVLIISDPSVVHFASTGSISVRADTTVIAPSMPYRTADGLSILYFPPSCDKIARSLFQSGVVWTSMDPAVRSSLLEFEGQIRIHKEHLPIVLWADEWENTRPKLGSRTPVVARHSDNFTDTWPNDPAVVEQLWPNHDGIDMRVLGDLRALHRKLGSSVLSSDWVAFREEEIIPQAFMSGIDFFVYFPDESHPQEFSREALEAAASGALVILPSQFEPVHKTSAVYSTPDEVPELIRYFSENKVEFISATNSAQSFIRKFDSATRYLEFTDSMRPSEVAG
jgi:hypothetical protein